MQVIQRSTGKRICWVGQNYYIQLSQLYAAYKYTLYLRSDIKTDIAKYHVETNCFVKKTGVIILALDKDSFKANAINGEF